MSSPVEEIKARLSITDVVGSYVRLQKAGSAYKALCPFHQEKSPSFTVSPTRQAFHCFGCNKGGDIFTFVEEIEGLDFAGALKVLAERAGVELKKEDRKATSERERMYSVMETATRFYVSRLKPEHPAYAYLTGRGLSPETIAAWRIGYAPAEPEGWRALSEALRERGITDAEIEKVGLSKKSEKKPGEWYDRFRSRVMFPIADSSGRVIAFSGRIFGDAKDETAKYVNSPETPLYDKSAALFGYDKAKSAIRKQNFALFVEGQMDLVMAHQAGTANAVAVSGTALTERHLQLVKRLTPNLVFAFDGDSAGVAATARAFALAQSLEMNVRVCVLPKGKDPADLILEDPKAWEAAIASSTHFIEFLLKDTVRPGAPALEMRKAVEERVLPYVAQLRSSIEQAHFVLEIARAIGVPDTAVWESLKRIRLIASYAVPKAASEGETAAQASMRQRLEEEISGLVLLLERPSEGIDPSAVAALPTLREEFARITGAPPLASASEALRSQAVMRVEQTYEPSTIRSELIEDLLLRLDLCVSEERQAEIHRQLASAEQAKDKEGIGKAMEAFHAVSKHIHELKARSRPTI